MWISILEGDRELGFFVGVVTNNNISPSPVMSNSIRLLLLNSNLKYYGYVLTLSKGLITLKVIVNAIISQNQNILFFGKN